MVRMVRSLADRTFQLWYEEDLEREGVWFVEPSMWDIILTYKVANDYFFNYAFAIFLLVLNILTQLFFAVTIGNVSFLGSSTSDLVGYARGWRYAVAHDEKNVDLYVGVNLWLITPND